jgi:hypothetical protein
MKKYVPVPPPEPSFNKNSPFKIYEKKPENVNEAKTENKNEGQKKVGKLNISNDLINKISSVYSGHNTDNITKNETVVNKIEQSKEIKETKETKETKKINHNTNLSKPEHIPVKMVNTNTQETELNNFNISLSDQSLNNILNFGKKFIKYNKSDKKNVEQNDKQNVENKVENKQNIEQNDKKNVEQNDKKNQIENNIVRNKKEFLILTTGFVFGYVWQTYMVSGDIFNFF